MALSEKRIKQLERAEEKLNATEWYDELLKRYLAENGLDEKRETLLASELDEKREALIDKLADIFRKHVYQYVETTFKDDAMAALVAAGVIFSNEDQ
jgi:hypothetical protein